MAALSLEQLVRHVESLPPLPDTALTVLRLTDDPNISTRQLAAAISEDIAFTSRILAMSNSAFYGMPRAIGTVNEAVQILGMRTLRSLALAAATCDTLKQELVGYQLAAGELWRHSVACAVGSQILAKRTRVARMEEAFVAGLLHDVGKVIMHVYVGPQFEAVRALVELDGIPFHEAERTVLAFDHAQVGAKMAERWNLPISLCGAIAGHHCLDRAEDSRALAAVVHVANAICPSGFTSHLTDGTLTTDPAARAQLSLDADDLSRLQDETMGCLDKSSSMLA